MKVHVSKYLRPIRFGLLQDVISVDGLLEAVRLNSFLWGGALNPIIPAGERPPDRWSRDIFGHPRDADQLVNLCIDRFAPDSLVVMPGSRTTVRLPARAVFDYSELSSQQILDRPANYVLNRFGISTVEVLDQYLAREMHYEQRHPIKFVQPTLGEECPLFEAVVFGALPDESDYLRLIETFGLTVERPSISLDDYLTYLHPRYAFIRRISGYGVWQYHVPPSFFILDPASPEDLADLLMLRAFGKNVVPIPKQSIGNQTFTALLREIVGGGAPEIRIPESISDIEIEHLIPQIGIEATFIRHRNGDSLEPELVKDEQPYHSQRSTVSLEAGRAAVHLIEPFDGGILTYPGRQFANDVEVSAFDAKRLPADVFPADLQTIWAPDMYYHLTNGRISKNSVTFYSHLDNEVDFPLPDATAIVRDFYRTKGCEAKPSDEGLRAAQALSVIGGLGEAWMLVTHSLDMLLTAEEAFGVDGVMSAREFHHACVRRERDEPDQRIRQTRANGHARRLLRIGVMGLGVSIQCDTCRRSPWFSMETLSPRLRCGYCHAEIRLLEKPDKLSNAWAYKLQAPFADRDVRSNLLGIFGAAGFFNEVRGSDKTICLGLDISRTDETSEVDLTILAEGRHGRFPSFDVVMVEAKGLYQFDEDDIFSFERIRTVLPRATYAFTTLRTGLEEHEKRLLQEFSERNSSNGYAPHNVVIVTRNEMMADMMLIPADDYWSNVRYGDLGSLGAATRTRYLA